MIPKRPLVGGLVFLVLGVGSAHAPAGGLEQRVAALVAALTLDEKIALVHSRFGMPLRVANEGLTGVSFWSARRRHGC